MRFDGRGCACDPVGLNARQKLPAEDGPQGPPAGLAPLLIK